MTPLSLLVTSFVGMMLIFVVAVLGEVSSSSKQDDVTDIAIVADNSVVPNINSHNDHYNAVAGDHTEAGGHLEQPLDTRSRTWRSSYGRHRRAKDDGVCELEIFCSGGREERTSGGVVRLPIRGQRGPSGPPGPPGEKGAKGQDGNGAVNAGSSSGGGGNSARRKVAFFAGLSENMGPVSENTDIKFDKIITNVGGAYDEASGKFIAPVDGVYQFNVIISAQGRQKAAVMMLKNGEMVTTVWAESVPSWGTSSNVAILQLAKGDRIWVSLLSRASYLHGYMYTTFSGVIVFDV